MRVKDNLNSKVAGEKHDSKYLERSLDFWDDTIFGSGMGVREKRLITLMLYDSARANCPFLQIF